MSAADDLSRKACERAAELRRLPEATYRLQFHAGFTFQDARRIVPYLRDLGVTHCYASPYLRPAGQHPRLRHHRSRLAQSGDRQQRGLQRPGAALKEHGLGQILDTVPNHMGIATNDNAWWNDILENGPASRYAEYFDIAWRASPRPELQDKVLLPVLGEPYGDVLEKGQLRLAFEGGAFTVSYYDRRFPLAPHSYGEVLGHRLEELERLDGTRVARLAGVPEHFDRSAEPTRSSGDRSRKSRRTAA